MENEHLLRVYAERDLAKKAVVESAERIQELLNRIEELEKQLNPILCGSESNRGQYLCELKAGHAGFCLNSGRFWQKK